MDRKPGKAADARAERERRLAAALRQNLKRRKSQARERSSEAPDVKMGKS